MLKRGSQLTFSTNHFYSFFLFFVAQLNDENLQRLSRLYSSHKWLIWCRAHSFVAFQIVLGRVQWIRKNRAQFQVASYH